MPFCARYPGPDDQATILVGGLPRVFPRGQAVALDRPEAGRLIAGGSLERVPTDDPDFASFVDWRSLELATSP